LGADTWAEGDIVCVDSEKCKSYGLGELEENVTLDVFFQRVGEIKIIKSNVETTVKERCVVHLVNIDTYDEDFTPQHVKNNNIYDKLINQMKRGDIVENINTDDYRSENILFFDGKDIIDRGKTIDKYGNIPKQFDMIDEFNPGYWDLNSEDMYNGEEKPFNINNTLVDDDSESTFYWNTGNYAFGYVDLNKLDCEIIKEKIHDVKYIKFTQNDKKNMIIYTDNDVKSIVSGKLAVKNVELYDCSELYKNFKIQMSEDLLKYQEIIRLINREFNYVMVTK